MDNHQTNQSQAVQNERAPRVHPYKKSSSRTPAEAPDYSFPHLHPPPPPPSLHPSYLALTAGGLPDPTRHPYPNPMMMFRNTMSYQPPPFLHPGFPIREQYALKSYDFMSSVRKQDNPDIIKPEPVRPGFDSKSHSFSIERLTAKDTKKENDVSKPSSQHPVPGNVTQSPPVNSSPGWNPHVHQGLCLNGHGNGPASPGHRASGDNMPAKAVDVLYWSVKWARNIPSFKQLPFRDQAILLEESWSELFVLAVAQSGLTINQASLLALCGPVSSDEQAYITNQVQMLQDIVARIHGLYIDATEYMCLRALVLFKTEVKGLKEERQVETLQEQAQLMLQDHCDATHQFRFGKLLLLLASVKAIQSKAISDIFFKKTVGQVPMERLICDMFKSC